MIYFFFSYINVNQKNKAYLYCDYKLQVEAITNILKNSIQNSYQNGIINITYEQKKIYTEIIIEDYGQGILKEDIPHIFERYYSKNNTGIGLNLAKMIIKENNGHISVSSNKTTTFTIKYMIQ